jgi:hypothetical protein
MEETRVSAQQVKRALAADFDRLAEGIAEAMNAARDGRIIADSEEPVRDAHAKFREEAYEKAIRLLQERQEGFSPSGPRAQEQGQAGDNASDGQRANPGA